MSLDLANRIRNVTAVLGPTNTGKTHLAIERMLGHDSGPDRPAAAPARARGLRQDRRARRRRQRRAHHRRGEDQAGAPALLGVHGRGHAARGRRRLPRHRRGAARGRPRARPRLHRPPAARARPAGDAAARRPDHARGDQPTSFPAPISSRGRACPSSPTPARRRSRACRRARRSSPSRRPRSTPSPS